MKQNAKSRLAAVRDLDLVQVTRDSAGRLGGGAGTLDETFAAKGEQLTKVLSRQISSRPFISLLNVVGIGFCVTRLFLSR